ncbi:hypothetical protein ACKI1S_16870 [Streptomyces galilaeus]|uniref:Uncharacterized protein n=1 Tax=Streptomyces galilaeus TaxID=33899 RepID=A0ABW9IH48_STRGJ
MSTPAPALASKDPSAPGPAATEPAPFNPHDFPADLRDAQRKAAELYAELRAYQKTLAWAREPHAGWPEEVERGKERRGRPETPGWTPEQAAKYDSLFEALRKATAAVQGHGHWKDCRDHGIDGADMVAVRQALKHAEGAVPALGRGDVEKVA